MFPPNQDDDWFYQIYQEDTIQQYQVQPAAVDMIQQDHVHKDSTAVGVTGAEGNNSARNKGKSRGKQKSPAAAAAENDWNTKDDEQRRVLHRDIERQRRKEMSATYASLRSLLPIEYLKGKRSISDHINETIKYINHLQKKIRDMSLKRYELKKMSGSSGMCKFGESSGEYSQSCLTIHPCQSGFEIVCSSSFREEGLPLSKVLKVLLKEGLDVVTCVSSKVNNVMFHTIQAEVGESANMETSELEAKLSEAFNQRHTHKLHSYP